MLQIAGGSVTGSSHQHKLNIKNNQDAFGWEYDLDRPTACAIVADGCGSGKASEIGAKIFGRRFGTLLHILQWNVDHEPEKYFKMARQIILEEIAELARKFEGAEIHKAIKDYFLFTINGVLLTEQYLTLFSIGDGVAYLNGNKIELPEYPNNAPPYLAYELIQDSLKNPTPELYKFKIHAQIPVEDFKTCLIGSDGVKDLENVSEFWTEDKYFQNPDQVRRKLAVINKRKGEQLGPLTDDTTLIVIRKVSDEPDHSQQADLCIAK